MKNILQKGKELKKDFFKGGEKKKDAGSVVFGGSIDRTSTQIPSVLNKCVEYLDATGLNFEGIFRKSGSLAQLNEIKARFDGGEDVDFSSVLDPHIVAGLLKKYVRELAEPLLTFELYDMFLAAVAIKDVKAKITKIRKVLAYLPSGHLVVVKYLVSFLCRVSAKSSENMMTPSNLAIVFAPNLLRPPYTGEQELAVIMEDTPYSNELLQIFISHHDKIFKDLETEVASETKIVNDSKQGFEPKPAEPKPIVAEKSQEISPRKAAGISAKPLPPLPNPHLVSLASDMEYTNKPLPQRPPPRAPPPNPSSISSPPRSYPLPDDKQSKALSPDSRRPAPNVSPGLKHRPTAIRQPVIEKTAQPPSPTTSPSSSSLSLHTQSSLPTPTANNDSPSNILAARSDLNRQNRFAISFGNVPRDAT